MNSSGEIQQPADRFNRRLGSLRVSVTDRCNMRCRYCMPASGVAKLDHSDILSYEDLYRIGRVAVDQGVEKIRVTGGEPLVRKGIVDFLGRLGRLPGLKDLVLTTNGQLLPGMAKALRDAGVQRVNVSLDSLEPETFVNMTRRGDLRQVIAGLMAADQAGLGLKINVVVMRGINDHEIDEFARLSLNRSVTVRFIEYMPALKEPNWRYRVVSGDEIMSRLAARYSLQAVDSAERSGPAREYRINGALGKLGVITAVSGHFCNSCNRIRVTATGMARSCLFAEAGVDLRPWLAEPADDGLAAGLRQLVVGKPARHGLDGDQSEYHAFAMAAIGG
jgi:cyclic pyranopterin phosphate synthase